MSDFSLHTSVDGGFFREDNGRKFQAHNDDYVLPADQQELDRLDHQHYGFKARQGGKNYLAPIKAVLGNDGRGKRILDVGTGSGIWAIEMAQEYPAAEVVGLDLAPVQKETVPENCRFEIDDASKGLPFPDGTFDVVHARLLTVGIRHWRGLVNDMVRVLQPGGLAVLVEMDGMLRLDGDIPLEQQREVAPGYTKFCDYLDMAIVKRGLDNLAGGSTIPQALAQHPDLQDLEQVYAPLPFWPWSEDPQMREAGRIMLGDSAEVPHACRLFIVDACEISMQQYDEVTRGWFHDLGREGVHSILPIWHNWAFKKVP
uniref:AdoMet-MTases n=1 Tax=Tremella fuciformis TaxID=64657 RepID=D5KY51_9TREE|nr:AdoMet-MTases [Tremella fuciformis]